MSRKIIFTMLLSLAFFINACGPAASQPASPKSITVKDGLGRDVTLDVPAQRVISLAPSNTEILFAIGAGAQMVGRDSLSDYPEEAKKVADIGGGFDKLNTELILSAKPDLVLAADINAPEQIKALEDLGVVVYVLPNPKSFDGLYANLETAAKLTGHEADAATLIESLKKRVSAVEEKLASVQEKPLAFYELDGTDANAPWTSGPNTFIDLLISMSGGKNVGGVLSGEWAQISLEELVTQDPDIIILGDTTYGGVTPEMVKARNGWDSIAAVKNDRVHSFDDNLISRPGPRLVDGLEAMAKLIHPELFK